MRQSALICCHPTFVRARNASCIHRCNGHPQHGNRRSRRRSSTFVTLPKHLTRVHLAHLDHFRKIHQPALIPPPLCRRPASPTARRRRARAPASCPLPAPPAPGRPAAGGAWCRRSGRRRGTLRPLRRGWVAGGRPLGSPDSPFEARSDRWGEMQANLEVLRCCVLACSILRTTACLHCSCRAKGGQPFRGQVGQERRRTARQSLRYCLLHCDILRTAVSVHGWCHVKGRQPFRGQAGQVGGAMAHSAAAFVQLRITRVGTAYGCVCVWRLLVPCCQGCCSGFATGGGWRGKTCPGVLFGLLSCRTLSHHQASLQRCAR